MTHTKVVTIWVLSRRETQWNRHTCEDLDYLHKNTYEASLFPEIDFGPFVGSSSGEKRKPLYEGVEPLMRLWKKKCIPVILRVCLGVILENVFSISNTWIIKIFKY